MFFPAPEKLYRPPPLRYNIGNKYAAGPLLNKAGLKKGGNVKNIIVLCGGRSTEHEISLRSARSVINELDRKKYKVHVCYIDKGGAFNMLGLVDHVGKSEDLMQKKGPDLLESVGDFCREIAKIDRPLIFSLIHGQSGEDGEIQGFLQSLGLPYVGSRLSSSALCMDKAFANDIFRAHGISKAPYMLYRMADWEKDGKKTDRLVHEIEKEIKFPCFVKPANNGSSIGVMKADKEHLEEAILNAFRYDRRILIEYAVEGSEIEVSVLGNADPQASKAGSYSSEHEVLDYNAKYNDKKTRENIPHPMDEEKMKEAQALAIEAYKAAGCEGFARVDLFLTPDGKLYVNEINTVPGMTPSSLASKLWTKLSDMTFADYLDKIIEYAEESEQELDQLETSWEQA